MFFFNFNDHSLVNCTDVFVNFYQFSRNFVSPIVEYLPRGKYSLDIRIKVSSRLLEC